MPGGGGGADLDVVTAGASNVEAGKVIVGPDGEPLTGMLTNLSQNPDTQYADGNTTPVIKGDAAFVQSNTDGVKRALIRYDGSSVRGKAIIQPNTLIGIPQADMATAGSLTAAKLAQGQSAFGLTGTYKGLGNAAAADVRKGKTFSTASLSNAAGTMAEKGAATYTPKTTAQTIAANQYLTGVQTIAGDANLVAGNIKKNVTIFGVKGAWEGYVANALDLYYRGVNNSGLKILPETPNTGGYPQDPSGSVIFTTDHIEYERPGSNTKYGAVITSSSYNLTGYNGVAIRYRLTKNTYSSATGAIEVWDDKPRISPYDSGDLGGKKYGSLDIKATSSTYFSTEREYLIPFDEGSHSLTSKISVVFRGQAFDDNGTNTGNMMYIYQIRLY